MNNTNTGHTMGHGRFDMWQSIGFPFLPKFQRALAVVKAYVRRLPSRS